VPPYQSASGILPEDQTLLKQDTLMVPVKDATLTAHLRLTLATATID
jgi:hypothetical protein